MESSNLQVLKQYWGHDGFRPLQEDIINSVYEGNDTLALLPTGGGKSICYQVPGIRLGGLTIVISPLIALMLDQVEALKKKGIKALVVHSGMTHEQIDITLDNAAYGDFKFLYIAPERIKTEMFKMRVGKMPIKLIAVDEAHCISQWGYDFRPAYREILKLRELLPEVPVIALTATATEKVSDDICQQLQLKDVAVFRSSYLRSNLIYKVEKTARKEAALERILKPNVSSIVYTRSRLLCKQLHNKLNDLGYNTCYYHAGLAFEVRSKIQADWIAGNKNVIVATNAFGMGIDKADVRQVIHMSTPDNLEAYVQEAGRAGRDGELSEAILLVTTNESLEARKKIIESYPPKTIISNIYLALCNHFRIAMGVGIDEVFAIRPLEFCKKYNFKLATFYHAIGLLQSNNYLTLSEGFSKPSTVHFKVEGKVLYDFQIRHNKLDNIIKLILRHHGGAFDKPVRINESKIAKALNISIVNVENQLKELVKYEIIDYKPKNILPTIRFEQDRINEQFLRLDPDTYENRLSDDTARLNAIVNYYQNDQCRQQSILSYFGEDGEKCGICDVCDPKERAARTMTAKTLPDKIKEVLNQEVMTIDELIKMLPEEKGIDVVQYVRKSADEGIISYADGMKLIWNK